MDSSVLEYFDIFLLVFARMGGMIFINPVFARKGVPLMVRTGLALALSLLIAPAARAGGQAVVLYSTFDMAEALVRELILGLGIGCVFQLFFYMLYVAGDLLDTAFGLAMGQGHGPHERGPDGDSGAVCEYILFPLLFCHWLPSADGPAVRLHI